MTTRLAVAAAVAEAPVAEATERRHPSNIQTELKETNTCESRSGQSIIESCIVMGIMCLVLLGVLQLSQLFAAKEILNYAASRGARAKAVGFNEFMVWKTMRVGVIPNAGVISSPEIERAASSLAIDTPTALWESWNSVFRETPASTQGETEQSRIPLYLGSDSRNQLQPILDYEDWDTVSVDDPTEDESGMVSATTSQDYPLRIPMHTAFYAGDNIELTGGARMENHHSLYLTDTGQ